MRLILTSIFAAVIFKTSSAYGQLGAVQNQVKITRDPAVFREPLAEGGGFGSALAFLGALDRERPDIFTIAIGAPRELFANDNQEYGTVFLVDIDSQGTVVPGSVRRINPDPVTLGGRFGKGLAYLPGLSASGVTALAVGASSDSPPDLAGAGAVWIMFFDARGTVLGQTEISADPGGPMEGLIQGSDEFGQGLAYIDTLPEACGGLPCIAVGSPSHDGDGFNRGAIWLLFLDANAEVTCIQKIAPNFGGFTGKLEDNDLFGKVISVGDVDQDGVPDLAVAAPGSDGELGAIWILFLNNGGTVKGQVKQAISCLDTNDQFGLGLAPLDTVDPLFPDNRILAVGRPGRFGDQNDVWLLSLDDTGSISHHLRIGDGEGGFEGEFEDFDVFGSAIEPLGDLDGNGVIDLAVGEPGDDDAGPSYGAFHILFLHDPMCRSDLNFDGVVDAKDLLRVLSDWGMEPCEESGDVNRDGSVDTIDLLILLGDWGPCPE